MHTIPEAALGMRTYPYRKPAWILLTALAFSVIGMVTVFGAVAGVTAE